MDYITKNTAQKMLWSNQSQVVRVRNGLAFGYGLISAPEKSERRNTDTWTPAQQLKICVGVLKASLKQVNAGLIKILSGQAETDESKEAFTWIFSTGSDRPQGLCFTECAQAAGLDPEQIRHGVRRAIVSAFRKSKGRGTQREMARGKANIARRKSSCAGFSGQSIALTDPAGYRRDRCQIDGQSSRLITIVDQDGEVLIDGAVLPH